MNTLFPVMAGGAIGAGARHLVGGAMLARFGPGFPWGTMTVNLVGGLAMGLLIGALMRTGGSEAWRLFLAVGVLGGFTTFSAFGLDVWMMIARGDWGVAGAYVIASGVGAVLLTALGMTLVRAL